MNQDELVAIVTAPSAAVIASLAAFLRSRGEVGEMREAATNELIDTLVAGMHSELLRTHELVAALQRENNELRERLAQTEGNQA